MNSITFDGRVAADSELRFTPSGEPILTFRVGSDIGYGDRKTTNWFACQIWGKRGESLQSYLSKGQQVTVYGQMTLREWTDKDGGKRLSPDVRVMELSLQGAKREEEQQQRSSAPRSSDKPEQRRPGNQPPEKMDDEYPF